MEILNVNENNNDINLNVSPLNVVEIKTDMLDLCINQKVFVGVC